MTPVRIVFVCLGNICRSPMAEAVMRSLLGQAGLADRVDVSSAGTGDWHIGEGADTRAAATLTARGYDASAHRARMFEASWFAQHDLVIAMDTTNLAALLRIAASYDREKVRLLLSFAPEVEETDVPDPYYGGPDGFTHALDLVEAGCRGLLDHVQASLVR